MPHEFWYDVTRNFRVLRFRQLIPFRIFSRMRQPHDDVSADLNPPAGAQGGCNPCSVKTHKVKVIEGGCARMTEKYITRGGFHG